MVRFHDSVFCNKTPQSVKLREQHTDSMCFYVNKNQYLAIKSAKNMIQDNLYEFTDLDIEYVGKERVWSSATTQIDKRNNSIVDKVALLSVLSSGSLVNGYWHMPRTEDACRKYKKIRKAWDSGKRPEFYDEYDDNWDEHYEVVSI